jgi:hypothetical protein
MNPRLRPALPQPELPFPEPSPPEAPLLESSGAPPPTPVSPPRAARAAGAPAPWDLCPNCGAELINERCKRRCTRCHYFMSCSDFD